MKNPIVAINYFKAVSQDKFFYEKDTEKFILKVNEILKKY